MKLEIGDSFTIKRKNNLHHCEIGQDVIIEDIDTYGKCYLVQDLHDVDYFINLQSVPFEDVE